MIDNNGIVSVVFSRNSNKTYNFLVPKYIDPVDIQNYVIVENSFYDSSYDLTPYCIVKVLKYYPEVHDDNKATKFIVSAINSNNYANLINYQRNKEKVNKDLDARLLNAFKNLSIETKSAILSIFDE